MDLEMKGIAGLFSFCKVMDEHIQFLNYIRNSPARKWFFDDRLVTMENHLKWYAKYTKSNDVLLVIKDSSNRVLIGTVGVKNYLKASSVEFGQFCISNSEYLSKGYAPIILTTLFHRLFDNGKDKITCQVLSDNSVLGLYVKLGFVVYDFEKDYEPYKGRTIDIVSLELTKERFYANYRF